MYHDDAVDHCSPQCVRQQQQLHLLGSQSLQISLKYPPGPAASLGWELRVMALLLKTLGPVVLAGPVSNPDIADIEGDSGSSRSVFWESLTIDHSFLKILIAFLARAYGIFLWMLIDYFCR